MPVQPYLMFNGRTEEALEFYKKALNAQPGMIMRFSESPEPSACPDGSVPPPDKIMHCNFTIAGNEILASDGMCDGNPKFEGISLAITYPDVATVEKAFAALTEGGQVQMPLTKTFFSEKFGMIQDKFGVSWMLMAEHA